MSSDTTGNLMAGDLTTRANLLTIFLVTGIAVTLLFTIPAFAGKTPAQTANNWMQFSRQEKPEIISGFPYLSCFKETAAEYDIPLALLLAVARGESDFQATAQSKKDCYGIMQIQWPGTAKDLGFRHKSELLSPCKNIKAGGRYLRMLLDRYQGNIHMAIAAYNYGLGRIIPGSKKIPDGAAWYSGYIYDHLQYVLERTLTRPTQDYGDTKKVRLIVFNDPVRARNFFKFVKTAVPEASFDWFRMGLGRYQIVLCYAGSEKLQRGRKLVNKRLGFIF